MLRSRRHNDHRRRVVATVIVAATLFGGVGLTGCSAHPDAEPSVSASPTSHYVFSSDAEALAAVKKTFRSYMHASDDVMHDGGANVERMKRFVSPSIYKKDVKVANTLSEKGQHGVGESSFDSMSIQRRQPSAGGEAIQVYVCDDVSSLRIVDESGSDVTPDSRADRMPLNVELRARSKSDLVIERSEVWSGENFC